MPTRLLTQLLLLAVLTIQSAALSADQTDPLLDELFTRLQVTDDATQLRFIENSIWEVWMQHDNADAEELLVIATRRMNQRRFSDAMLIFNRLVETFPEYAEAWNKRATLHYMLGDLEASLADIDVTLTLEPRHFGALSGQGLIYVEQEKLQQARESFEHLLTIHPNSGNARSNLESILADLRRNLI